MTRAIDDTAITAAAAARISDLIRSADLTTPVDHLGRWKVRDVVAHLGGVHRWATRIVVNRSQDGPSFTKSKLAGIELCDWFDEGVGELVAAFTAADPESPCPNFNPGSANTVAFWLRRQMHETTIHRWDVEQALHSTTPIAPAVAADGIDEYLDVFVRTRGKQTLTAPLALSTAVPARSWLLAPADKPGRVDVHAEPVHDPVAEISGAPDQLLLMLWGRLALDQAELTVTGDAAVAHSL